MSFKGKNINLRAIEPGDLDVMYLWENNIENWLISSTQTPFSKYTLSEYISSVQDIYLSKQLRFIIEHNEDSTAIGCIDFFDFDPNHLRAGLGILIGNLNYRKKGYATESIELVIDYAFNHLLLKQLYCNILESNTESLRLFEKFGFEKIGLKKSWIQTPYGFENEWLLQKILR